MKINRFLKLSHEKNKWINKNNLFLKKIKLNICSYNQQNIKLWLNFVVKQVFLRDSRYFFSLSTMVYLDDVIYLFILLSDYKSFWIEKYYNF